MLKYFLGIEISRASNGIFFTWEEIWYVLDLLHETSMSGCKPVDALMDPHVRLAFDEGLC